MIRFELIVRYMDGAASPGEAMLVDDWINETDENRQFFQQIYQVWLEQGNEIYTMPDVITEWDNFQTRYSSYISPERKTIPFLKIAAAACIFFAIGIGVFWYTDKKSSLTDKEQVVTALANPQTITLPDSSVVRLEANSALHYPQNFKGNERKVKLDGNAAFFISHNKEKPFIIDLETGSHVKVLGTSFRLRQRSDTAWLKVLTGKVAFYNAGDTITVEANEEASYTANSFFIIPNSRYIKSRTGTFYFNDEHLSVVTAQLAAYYKVSIILEDKGLSNCRITAQFDHKTLEEIIPIISATLNIQSQIHEGTIHISGKGCN